MTTRRRRQQLSRGFFLVLAVALKSGGELRLAIDASMEVDADNSSGLRQEIEQMLRDLNLADRVRVDLK